MRWRRTRTRKRALRGKLHELPGAEMKQINAFPLIAMLVIVLFLIFWLM